MRSENLPEYAKKFKVKGYDVKKVGNKYYQYKVEHHREKDKKYPITKFIYIGLIDEKKGLIKAHTQKEEEIEGYLEYGLSNYIYSTFKRTLQRSLFNCSGPYGEIMIKIGIIKYIFNEVTKEALESSYLTYESAEETYELYIKNEKRYEEKNLIITNKISKLLEDRIEDEKKRKKLINSLRNMNVVVSKKSKKINTIYTKEVEEILKRKK